MRHDDSYLIDMLQAARKAAAFAADLTYPQFQASDLHQNAILKVLEIIGEAASRITTQTHRAYPQIPWRQIIGLRNRVVHGYFEVDLNLIWQIVHQDIPILLDQLQDLLPPNAD